MSEQRPTQQQLERALERERRARHEAEQLLESKSLELFEANEALRVREQYARAVFDAIEDGILLVDHAGCIEAANPAVLEMVGEDELAGRLASECFVDDFEPTQTGVPFEAGLIRSDRSILQVRVTRSEVMLKDVMHTVLAIHDRTEELATGNALRRTAFMDQLTGLGNRASLVDRYETRQPGEGAQVFAVVVFDLQRFGRINDALGRASGDLALREIALRLRDHARETLRREPRLNEFVVARIGGDEFAVLIRGRDVTAIVMPEIAAILEEIQRPFTLAGVPIALEPHVGYCLGEELVGDINGVLDRAVIAVEDVADRRTDAIAEFRAEMATDRRRVVEMEGRILRALENGEFHVYFQPRVDLTSGRIVSAEALVRWHHPERGVLMPGAFIEIAEQSAIIVALGEVVLAKVLAFCRRALDLGLDPHVSVNVSSIEFTMLGFVERLRESVAAAAIAPSAIEFEIKESVIASDVTHAMEVIEAFSREGFQISLDDFGTGHSSLNRLTELPVDVIKLDQRFLWGASVGADGRKILEAVVALTSAIGAELVVEGAETNEQLDLLRSIGVQYVQGFAFSPAVDEETFLSFLQRQPWLAEPRAVLG